MKKLLIFITLTLALALTPLNHASCEEEAALPEESATLDDSTTTDEDGDEPAEKGAIAAASALAGGSEIASGTVGKAQSLSPLLSESFQTDLATGSATVSVPIVVPPGRKNMQPNLGLSYSSNNSNGICGVGWALTSSSIQRSTKKGPPTYNDDDDTFVFSSSGSTGELIEISKDGATREFRQKIETAFMKYLYNASVWTIYDKNGTKYTFGSNTASQIESDGKIFAWYLDKVEDVHGNYLTYIYEKLGGQIYLTDVKYTGDTGLNPDKHIIFNYEQDRSDKIYNYRSGWKIETAQLLQEIHINVDREFKWKYVLEYDKSEDTDRSLLLEIRLQDKDGNSLPPKKFTYQTIE